MSEIKRLGAGRKIMFWGVAVATVAGLLAAGVWGWLRPVPEEGVAETPETVDEGTPEVPVVDEPVPVGQIPELVVDGSGLPVMPVTGDAAVAAAGAAAIMFTLPTASYTRTEYFEEAIHRITHPHPDYVGGDGQVHTFVRNEFGIPANEFDPYLPADEALLTKVNYVGNRYDSPISRPYDIYTRTNFGWQAALADRYQQLRSWQIEQTGTPVWVMSEDEMRAWYPGAVLPEELVADVDLMPDVAGASLTTWYVMVEVRDGLIDRPGEGGMIEGIGVQVWCDPPEHGGWCGVAGTVDRPLPTSWPNRSIPE